MKYEEQNNIKKLDIFSSENKKGTIAFTETKFGYHIIRIDDQEDLNPVYQFSIIIKTLVPSKKTEDSLHKNVVLFIKQNKNSNLNTLINNPRR